MKNVLITGAAGFIGRALCPLLVSDGYFVRGTLLEHENLDVLASGVEPEVIEPIDGFTPWNHALTGVHTLVHLAARVHILHENSVNPLNDFRLVNTIGTERLAREAAVAGVKRFIFMSTIGVNGDHSGTGAFVEPDDPHPHNAYSVSKWEAEQVLLEISKKTGMEVVIIRPPLVYGANAPGNFATLVRWVSKGIPLPLGAIHNRRSLIGIDNLIDFIITCIDHPAAANQTFLVSDGEDVSTTELLRKTATAIGKKTILLPVPVGIMRFMAKLLGETVGANRLFGSLQVDISKARNLLGWNPLISVDEGLRRTVLGLKKT